MMNRYGFLEKKEHPWQIDCEAALKIVNKKKEKNKKKKKTTIKFDKIIDNAK